MIAIRALYEDRTAKGRKGLAIYFDEPAEGDAMTAAMDEMGRGEYARSVRTSHLFPVTFMRIEAVDEFLGKLGALGLRLDVDLP